MVAMILPFSGMMMAQAAPNENASDKAKQIVKPEESQSEKNEHQKVEKLFRESIDLMREGKQINDINQVEKNDKRLKEIKAEIGVINSKSQKLYALTPTEKNQVINAKKIIRDSDIPYLGLGIDHKVGALVIGFDTQEIADAHISTIEEIIEVKYYINIVEEQDEFLSCTYQTSNCTPLMGGIKISTQKSGSSWTSCSYSIPAVRNVFWWTETGFVTAAHCFNGNNGNDAKQPNTSSSKIGDVTAIKLGGECDCAFLEKTGSESTLFGNWWGTGQSNQLISKSDPLLGSYVVMIGYTSGIKVGKVIDNSYDTTTSPSIQNTIKVNYAMSGGDSGGTVIDLTTFNVYHGLISSGHSGGGYTAVIPWSHIDNGLNLR